ncbi:hypothetical protein BTA51_28210 [Hahella sp. CCB-MM4]|uniref:HET-C-related protein n=1 Tax=Hahella sp. (strain CCB-MM4) TaxID=1926491 RepID=UPI000B9B87BB|nr:HET-C-related protein [Hahella sp. CCB-MM4]OZG70014.1 hypothetical protein BTA51_28210 [Hahella sp. CCB-MM4]
MNVNTVSGSDTTNSSSVSGSGNGIGNGIESGIASGIERGIGSDSGSNISQNLKDLAGQGTSRFTETLSPIFGSDIPTNAYESLRQDILKGQMPEAPVIVAYSGLGDALAAYDQSRQQILISSDLAYQSAPGSEQLQQRAIAEETGHHIDSLLRNHYSDIGGDARADEGAKFARDIGGFAVADGEIQHDGKKGSLEFFEANGHKAIVTDSVYSAWRNPVGDNANLNQLSKEVYFGNWLRDMSNAYDPAGVAKVSKVVAPHVQNDPNWVKDLGLDPASKPGLEQIEKALTDDLLATIAEGIRIKAKVDFGQDITAKDIGAYSQVEHIDNPYSSMAEQKNNFDPATGVSNHIMESRDRMIGMLKQAFEADATTEGRRMLGDATHTMEDLFAHSNFIEISVNSELSRTGKGNTVETWGPQVSVNGGNRTLLTTGGFGDTDIGYSLAPAAAEAMFSTKEPGAVDSGQVMKESLASWQGMMGVAAEDGQRPTLKYYDKVVEILAEERGIDVKGIIDTKNLIMAAFAPMKLLVPDAYRQIESLVNEGGNMMVNGAAEGIPIQQSIQYDSESVLPSHSQLAKDHDDHHFHSLGIDLGTMATTEIVDSMKQAWDLKAQGDMQGAEAALNQAIDKVNGFFVHPDDSTNATVHAVISEWVANPQNSAAIERAGYISDLHQVVAGLPGMNEQSAQKLLQSVVAGSPDADIMTTVQDNVVKSVSDRFNQWFSTEQKP